MEEQLVECASQPIITTEEAARTIDEISKSLPQECKDTYLYKAYDAYYQFEPSERAEVSVISSEHKDYQDDVILQAGIDFTEYRKHGTVLFNHNKNKGGVAHCDWIKHYSGDNTIRAKTSYPTRPEGVEEWLTDYLWDLTRSDPPLIKCKSIGYKPLTPPREPTASELEAHPQWQGANVYEKGICLEYSICSVGMNSDALLQHVNKDAGQCEMLCKALDVAYAPPAQAPAEAQPVIEATGGLEWCLEKAAGDDCLSAKIKYLYDSGEVEKHGWTDKQVVAVAASYCGVSYKRKKKAVSIEELIVKAIRGVDVKTLFQGRI